MDLSTVVLFSVIGVMASNQLIMRRSTYRPGAGVFWSLQAANAVVGTGVIAFGMPGFERWPLVPWIVGMLLFVHIVQNVLLRNRWADEERRERREAEDEALLERIRREDEARDREES